MKPNSSVLLLSIFLLSACTHTNSLDGGFASSSQSLLYGWVAFDDYIAPLSTSVDIDVCQVTGERCITVAKQTYQGVHLPVQYSFVIAPIQAGKGEMKIRAVLRSQGEVRASKEESYIFTQGRVHKDLKLETNGNN
ncbi:YscW family type III secretion system pilotin [Grimontia marina]|uniref:Type III secretion system lipoprotein chaperone (YscW) n=1 Tax=Grimontia marina TaxID=646534 RepID=A0A128FJF9_9GAMM|nr:YscW family type III secretion system pilotin [Grimontia marina]CZF86411.1 Type III secretion system lipoprotein chaperone (YscW) [Grimontia marina]